MKIRFVSSPGRSRKLRWQHRRVMRYVSAATIRRGCATMAARKANPVPSREGPILEDSHQPELARPVSTPARTPVSNDRVTSDRQTERQREQRQRHPSQLSHPFRYTSAAATSPVPTTSLRRPAACGGVSAASPIPVTWLRQQQQPAAAASSSASPTLAAATRRRRPLRRRGNQSRGRLAEARRAKPRSSHPRRSPRHGRHGADQRPSQTPLPSPASTPSL